MWRQFGKRSFHQAWHFAWQLCNRDGRFGKGI
jgi:hypothetical protein